VNDVSDADPDTVCARAPFPLVVDLDGTFLTVDTLYELFASGLFAKPVETIRALSVLRHGIAAFKRQLCSIAELDFEMLPVRDELLTYLRTRPKRGGRSISLRPPIRSLHLAWPRDFRSSKRLRGRIKTST